MKGTILSGVLAASLLLTGCASMLTREYGSVEPHSATLVSEGDANTLRAEKLSGCGQRLDLLHQPGGGERLHPL